MNHVSETASLEGYLAHWHPAAIESADDLHPSRAAALAATLDLDDAPAGGGALPLLWHWAYFLDWPSTGQLGLDGHPRDGRFLPPIPNRRRMFAGGRVDIIAPLEVGEAALRRSCIANTAVKSGRTGEMLFVTVRHEYHQHDRVKLVEEQDLVYRSDDGRLTASEPLVEPLAATLAPWQMLPVTTPTLLFRFSAVTGNSHRIHYDQPYTTGVEGFPDLVVHGPLLALYMAELLRNKEKRPLARFEFRLRKPVFVGDVIRVEGTPAAGSADLAVVSGASSVHATATATYA